MLLYLICKIISSTGAFLYPGYASYKTLSKRPANEADLERWLMYWSVLSVIHAIEYVAEWSVSWIPFYWWFKTAFLLYLALPQTQGATALYKQHLQPFLTTYEPQIDEFLTKVKAKVYEFLQEKLQQLWRQVNGQQPPEPTSATAAPAPSLNDPVSGPVQMVMGLWRVYAPAVIASGAAYIASKQEEQRRAAQANQGPSPPPSPPASLGSNRPQDTASILERRRQLEEELASLPIPSTPSSFGPVASSDESQASEDDRYEDVDRDEVGDVGRRPNATKRTSWFGWGGGAAAQGYESLKND